MKKNPMEVGARVRVIDGNFAGRVGRIVSITPGCRGVAKRFDIVLDEGRAKITGCLEDSLVGAQSASGEYND